MKVVITGGTGQLGGVVQRSLRASGHEVAVIGRGERAEVRWDGRTVGDWAAHVDGADVVLNLAGRTVNCRYTAENLREMMDSRVDSTRAVGLAIAASTRPPRLWLQMSTATIYAHRFDAPNDEHTGRIGGDEPDAPRYWRTSVEIARAWERTLDEADTPRTRKVALRTAMVMSPERGSVFDVLSWLVRLGLGGRAGSGAQYVSWLHEHDFVRALELLIARDDLAGAFNLCAPEPLPQHAFMAALRAAWGQPLGLPATKWMLELGAVFLRTDTELILKSRRVVPARLAEAGFAFAFPSWPAAAEELVRRRRARPAAALPAPSSER